MNGQIIKIISNLYTVKTIDGGLYGCRARGKFRNLRISPIVGDNVTIDIDNNLITEIKERRNELKRPIISNVDVALIISSTTHPELDLYLLDKLVSLVTYNNIEPVICFTKLDLLNESKKEMIKNLKKYYEHIGIKVFYNTDTKEIIDYLQNKIVVLCGQTGAGKSSLLNRLDSKLNIETNEISEALGRGKHTTRHTELYNINGAYIADTPGFSALDLDIPKEDLKYTFNEFMEYECKFRDCNHDKENNCGVKDAVQKKLILSSRYENYLLFLKEVKK
jgi:ribosome biogenesis GTPase